MSFVSPNLLQASIS